MVVAQVPIVQLPFELITQRSRVQKNGDEISPHGPQYKNGTSFQAFFAFPIASLHGIAPRPLPCNYNVFEFVCACCSDVLIVETRGNEREGN